MSRTTADQAKIIQHRAFDRVVDSAYTDVNDLPIGPVTALDECQNLDLFRKIGSAKQAKGHSLLFANADLPNSTSYGLTDFEPVDMYFFSLDKDSKEITVLVYQHTTTGEIRIFITPWYNPGLAFNNNNNPLVNADSWISSGTYKWMELTERYDGVINATALGNLIFAVGDGITNPFNPITAANGYLQNYFVVNKNTTRSNRFNYIFTHTYGAAVHGFVTEMRITATGGVDWANGDAVCIVKFPVTYLYSMDAENFGNEGAAFNGKPTQFIYRENQLRMPCGKEKRPLILEFIDKAKFFLGNWDKAYEGFWFDFQQIPQVLKRSCITGFPTRTGAPAGATSWDISTGTISSNNAWVASGTGRVNITLYSGTQVLTVWKLIEGTNSLFDTFDEAVVYFGGTVLLSGKVGLKGNTIFLANNLNAVAPKLTADQLRDAINNSPLYPTFRATTTAAGDILTSNTAPTLPVPIYLNGGSKTFMSTTGTIFLAIEAGGNVTAFNPFIGMIVTAVASTAGQDVQRNIHFLTAIINNRSQILISHGTFSAKVDGDGLIIKFNPWFSRRLTGISLYNQKIDPATGASNNQVTYVISQEKYPFFLYTKEIGKSPILLKANEIKHFGQYDIYDFSRDLHGELVTGIEDAPDIANGLNAYTQDIVNGYWYTIIRNGVNGIATDGKGLRFISKLNRYIDQDTTMNYTRAEFLGQTNGRFFLIGVKNTVELNTFESNDVVVYNLYAQAVSEYDTYLRDRNMPVMFGDKDQIREILNYNGYMFLIKDTNDYALEVNTDNEVKYRVIDTKLGRGASSPNLVLQTPFGIVQLAKDSVWLVNQNETIPLLTEDNGKLSLYKQLFVSSNPFIIYRTDYNELLVGFTAINTEVSPNTYTTYIFVYSFRAKKWGGYYYYEGLSNSAVGIKPRVFRLNSSKEVCFINWHNLSNWNVVKLDDTSSVFKCADGSSQNIVFKLLTHYLAYFGRVQDIVLQYFGLKYDATFTSTKSVNVKINRGGSQTQETVALSLTTGNHRDKETLLKAMGNSNVMSFEISNNSSNNFTDLTINEVDLWIAPQERPKPQNL